MKNFFAKLWNDDAGVVALEYLLVATIVALGVITGLGTVTRALNVEFTELANAIVALDQSYSYASSSTCAAAKSGSTFADNTGAQYILSGTSPALVGGANINPIVTSTQSICP
jgi:Flp pilus assembly pilin Flp